MFANSSVFKASGSINGPIRNRQIMQPPSAENRKDMSAPSQKLGLKSENSDAASRWRKAMLDLLSIEYDGFVLVI